MNKYNDAKSELLSGSFPQAYIDQYRRNVEAGIPIPLSLDEELDTCFIMLLLPPDQQVAVRSAASPAEKRTLLRDFIYRFAAEE